MTSVEYVLNEEATRAIEQTLAAFMASSRSKCVLLLAKTGHLISQAGFTAGFNVQSISALIGGIFNSTQALAHIVGEEKFKVMFQEGQTWNVYLSLVSDQFILATIFDKSTVIGMIRNYAYEAERLLEPHLLKSIVTETTTGPATFRYQAASLALPSAEEAGAPAESVEVLDFNQAVEDALSKLFS